MQCSSNHPQPSPSAEETRAKLCNDTAEEPREEDRSPQSTATCSLWTLAGRDPVSSAYKIEQWTSAEPHEMAVRSMKETRIGPQSSLLEGRTAGGKPRKTSAGESRTPRLPGFLPTRLVISNFHSLLCCGFRQMYLRSWLMILCCEKVRH